MATENDFEKIITEILMEDDLTKSQLFEELKRNHKKVGINNITELTGVLKILEQQGIIEIKKVGVYHIVKLRRNKK